MTVTSPPRTTGNHGLTSGNTPKTSIAREYLRVSKDRSGHARSVEEQTGDNRRAADANGWTLGAPYEDNDRSASRYARKVREGFERLIDDLEHNRFGADILIIWESSRGSRKVSEWVVLIELCEQRGVRIHVTTHQRTYNPSNGRDRRSLLEDSVDSEYEVSKMSERIRRDAAALAAKGKPTGRCPYGYVREYDPQTRQLLAQKPDPKTAPMIKELFERIAAGHSLRSIARHFETEGFTNQSGRPFTAAHLRALAETYSYAGLRVHTPGGGGMSRNPPGMQVIEGTWEPIVSRELFWAVQQILSDPSRKTSRPGRSVHLLSMIARCAVCGSPLVSRSVDAKHRLSYACRSTRGCVRISEPDLDELVTKVMLTFLADEEAVNEHIGDVDSAELQSARDAVETIQAELKDLGRQVGAGRLSATLAAQAEPMIKERLKAAEDHLAEVGTPNRLRGLITPGPTAAAQWEAAGTPVRREIARLLLLPSVLGELRVHPVEKTGRKPTPVRDRVEWFDGTNRRIGRAERAAADFEPVMTSIRELIQEQSRLGPAKLGKLIADRFGGRLTGLDVGLRRRVVAELSAAGMSTRNIAPVIGVDYTTVIADRRALNDVRS